MAGPSEDGLFREIDEELRHERYAKLWKRYGHYIIAAALALVIGVAGYQGWRAYDAKRRLAEGESFAAALSLMQSDKDDAAAEALAKLAQDAGSGYRVLARLQEAALLAKRGNVAGAGAIYREIAEDSRIKATYRDLATLLGVLHEMDSAPPGELTRRLAPLTADDNPWRHSARELSALLAVRAGNVDHARKLYKSLAADATAPQGIRSRAAEMLAALGQ